jgi:hypothetical protein
MAALAVAMAPRFLHGDATVSTRANVDGAQTQIQIQREREIIEKESDDVTEESRGTDAGTGE